MGKWIGYILIIALIIAIFTAPSAEKFNKFAEEKTAGSTCKPYVEYKNYKLLVSVFGIGYLKECKGSTRIYDPKTGKYVGNVALPNYSESQAYLGLFGRFWKL
jgi:hypothetical protein